jgi:hypothetical protein
MGASLPLTGPRDGRLLSTHCRHSLVTRRMTAFGQTRRSLERAGMARVDPKRTNIQLAMHVGAKHANPELPPILGGHSRSLRASVGLPGLPVPSFLHRLLGKIARFY